MPLLRRQPFSKEKLPPGLKPDDEIFHCTITNEVFVDYEKFFERIILCNSMVWTCSMTGRSGLTYQEALDCEAKARKQLSSFPDYLQKPILYLATLTHRSRLNDLNDDVFQFTKDRFFINEVVEVLHDGDKKTCRVIKVISPKLDVVTNGDAGEDTDSDVICLDDEPKPTTSDGASPSLGADADKFQYVVQEIKKPNIYIVGPQQLSRKKGLYTREKSKLYLKQHCNSEGNGIWKVKSRYMKKFGLSEIRWESLFDGPQPKFAVVQAKKVAKSTSSKKSVIDLTGEDDMISKAKQEKKLKKQKSKELKAKEREERKKEAKKEARKKLKEEQDSLKEVKTLEEAMKLGQLLAPVIIAEDLIPVLPQCSSNQETQPGPSRMDDDTPRQLPPSPLQLGEYVKSLTPEEITSLVKKLREKNKQEAKEKRVRLKLERLQKEQQRFETLREQLKETRRKEREAKRKSKKKKVPTATLR